MLLPRRYLWAQIFFFFFIIFASADEKTDKVDKLFAQWDTTVTPGAALAIIKDGEIIYKRGYGMAKLEDDIIMTPSKVFDIGSVSKQFTAACVAILAREGKVSLDDDIRKYIPEMPRYERAITLRHLIHHTSGIRDYNSLLSLAGFRPDSDCPIVEEAIKIIASQKKLNFIPGEEYSYSNSGYFLLGVIVERVSGKTLNEFAQEHIFKPLGMKNTFFQDDHTQIIKNRASGYSTSGKSFRLNMSNWDEVGDGNVYTSVEDLYLWDQSFYNYKLGKDLMDILLTPGTLNNGKKLDYAFGLVLGEYNGLKTIGHGGSWAGFRAGYVRFPEHKFSVICLANLSTVNPSALCLKVADIYLEDKFYKTAEEKKEKIEPNELSAEELKEKEGNYQEQKFGMWIIVSVKENKLQIEMRGQKFLLYPISKSVFKTIDSSADLTLEFLPEEKEKPREALLSLRGTESYLLRKAKPAIPLISTQLEEYTGEYVSEELLNVSYRIVVEKGNLTVKFRNAPKEPLKQMAPDQFTAEGMNFDFLRGKGKRISGFRLSVGRAANVEFIKKSL